MKLWTKKLDKKNENTKYKPGGSEDVFKMASDVDVGSGDASERNGG